MVYTDVDISSSIGILANLRGRRGSGLRLMACRILLKHELKLLCTLCLCIEVSFVRDEVFVGATGGWLESSERERGRVNLVG